MASSHSRFLNRLPLRSSTKRLYILPSSSSSSFHFHSSPLNFHLSIIQRESYRCCVRRNVLLTRAFDEDSFDMPMLDDWNADESSLAHEFSSSDGEDSDDEVLLTPVNDVDLPSVSVSNNEAITLAAHRFANLGRDRKKHRIKRGIFITMGLISVLIMVFLYVDWCAWRIVRLPLSPFYLTRPFLISAVLVSFAGYVCVPIFRRFNVVHVIKQQGPFRRRSSKRTPTLGGLFFIPVGITVAQVIAGSSSIEVSGAAGVTIAFAAVGLLNDILSLTKNHRRGLPAFAEVLLEGAVGTWFSFWLDINSISSPYGMYTFLLLI
ncbi:putative glycosyl transferase, family 4 [Lupinus albus]|uniref:Putative glycosyl transferase, family 4 n=1 Tax=Lupinus albus TaxID=3870 RepID=A0A6A4P4L6_LUPAL|nr:putative glycosyl transferase, family 4 [Lupinus albus]